MTKLEVDMGSIKKGETYWVSHPRLKEPKQAKVIVLTTNLSKQVGVEFEDPIGAHDCDGRGKLGHCLWVRTEHVLNQLAFEELAKLRAISLQHQLDVSTEEEIEELPIL